ncbi:DUF2935 domain-containing protein [Paenibacillus thermotolerans]|uniref:DUF2935 domain-containing protein n=1 Tax=Paenibacillus thermotolerans TaxID=3027807 RepID=UPI002367AD50|nr:MULTISPECIES: DUF2935 domain-containing protein [unclassified Paenibacillus]
MNFREVASFELRFWLQIFGDHARFIAESLAPSETERIAAAEAFIVQFDALLEKSRRELDDRQLAELANASRQAGERLREFKLSLLQAHLIGSIKSGLPPTFYNHMVNELEEGLRVIDFLAQGRQPPVMHPLHHDLLWLLDAAGHASAINDKLDGAEKKLKLLSETYTKDWEEFYLKAIELAGYLRANVQRFPALSKFHKDIELEMAMFRKFLQELEEMRLSKEALGTFAPLMADHMAREECYYLTKLSETAELKRPACDPTKPRTEEVAAENVKK